MNNESRFAFTSIMWFMSVILLVGIFIGAGIQGEFTAWHGGFAITILLVAISATPIFLRLNFRGEQQEKSKRERIDTMLRDMSDEDLMELKQRLSDGDMTDESILDYLSDDGELVLRS